MKAQEEKLHPLLERWIERLIGLIGRFFYLGMNGKSELTEVFRNLFLGIGVVILLVVVYSLPILLTFLHEYINSK